MSGKWILLVLCIGWWIPAVADCADRAIRDALTSEPIETIVTYLATAVLGALIGVQIHRIFGRG